MSIESALEPHVTAPRPFCFVLMPFAPEFNDIYKFGIQGACEDAGAYSERVDEQIYEGTVMDRVYNQISKSDIVVADMTGRNPNVFYEVGYAHALGKVVVLLTKDAGDIPFDLRVYPHIVYEGEISKLRTELSKQIVHYINISKHSERHTSLDIRLYINGVQVTEVDQKVKTPTNSAAHFTHYLTVINCTTQPFYNATVKVAAFVEADADCTTFKYTTKFNAPGGESYMVIAKPETLLVDEPYKMDYFLSVKKRNDRAKVVFRVYTPLGTQDFPVIFVGDESLNAN